MQGKARQDKQQGRKAKATLQVGCFGNLNLRQFFKKFSQLKKALHHMYAEFSFQDRRMFDCLLLQTICSVLPQLN